MKTPLTLAALLVTASIAQAADAPPRDRLVLTAMASVEVTRDVLGVSFWATLDGNDAAAVQSSLKQALDAALAEARKIAKPGQVDVQTGNFSLRPRYTAKGGISGWQGTAELLVEGKDVAAIAQLTSRISSMNIARVGYSLSKEARDKVEADVAAQAIARYKVRAADYARQFGYGSYILGEVNINTDGGGAMPMVMQQMRMKTASASMDEALPVEAGKATVSVTVSGSIQMSK